MQHHKVLLIIMLLLWGCTKTEYIIEAPEPGDQGIIPASFAVSVVKVTDTWASIEWEINSYNASCQVKYEVAVNDSVVAYDLEAGTYRVRELQPHTRYVVSVIALDSLRNATTVQTEVQTMKPFVEGLIAFDFAFDTGQHVFDKALETSDGGLLIGGRAHLPFVAKLDDSYNVGFTHVFQSSDLVMDLLQTKEGGYLVVMSKSVTLLDPSGNELWTFFHDYPGTLQLKCATRDVDGSYIIAGTSNRNYGTDISLEYCLIRLSQHGALLWNRFGGTTLFSEANDIVTDAGGRIVVFGSSEYLGKGMDQISSAKVSFWLLWADENGDFLEQKFYRNQYAGSDLPFAITPTAEGNYLLWGTATGSLPPYGYYNTIPRFLKVSSTGDIIWEHYHKLNSSGVFPSVKGFASKENEGYVILTSDDRGRAIAEMNSEGGIERHIRLPGFPRLVFIRSNYHCITGDGRILLLNHDGYIDDLWNSF